MPDRIQLSRAKGWRMPPNTVKGDRMTKWGNPFVIGCRFRGLIRPGMGCGFADSADIARRKSVDLVDYLRARRSIADPTMRPFVVFYMRTKRRARQNHLCALAQQWGGYATNATESMKGT